MIVFLIILLIALILILLFTKLLPNKTDVAKVPEYTEAKSYFDLECNKWHESQGHTEQTSQIFSSKQMIFETRWVDESGNDVTNKSMF